MIIFVVILLLFMLYKVKLCKVNNYHTDYIAPRQTTNINAIFTILIFLSHSVQYFEPGGKLDDPYLALREFLGQLVVAAFLFYSGFGIMHSISKKGMSYVNTIPTKRFFKVWYHFAFALVGFIIINLIFNIDYSLKNNIFAFTGYTGIGNSNWYMFVTFALYFVVYFAFIIARKNNVAGVMLAMSFTIAFAVFERRLGLPSRYYNTIMCYPAGMMFSLIKPHFDKFVMKNDFYWLFSFILSGGMFVYFSRHRETSDIHYNLFSILAVIVIIIFTMKVKIENEVFDWIGKHIFSIFILQRIPMNIYEALGYQINKYFFVVISFVITIILALLFDMAMDKLDNLIFRKKPKKEVKKA